MLVNALTLLIDEETLVSLEEVRHHRSARAGSTSAALPASTLAARLALSFGSGIVTEVFLEVKVSHDVVRIEIVFLHTVGSRYFTSVVHFFLVEHLSLSVVV